MRWRRISGDLFVAKNRVDPKLRFSYEHYSYATNYNLLPASMLALAYPFADDEVGEAHSFAEVGGFVAHIKELNKVIANANGMYVEIELFPDSPEHDALGLTRVHHPSADPLLTGSASVP